MLQTKDQRSLRVDDVIMSEVFCLNQEREQSWPACSCFAAARSYAISNLESSGSLASDWSPGKTLGYWILLPQDFCGKTMETVTEQPSKKFRQNFSSPESFLAINRWPKSLRTLGTRLVHTARCYHGYFGAWHRLHVFPRLAPVPCFPALGTSFMFSRVRHRWHVFSRLAVVACLPLLNFRLLLIF